MHPLLRLAPLLRPQRGLLVLSVLGLLVGTALSLAGPWLVARAIDVDIAANDLRGLAVTSAIYLAVVLANLGVTYGSHIASEVVAQGAMVRLKRRLFRHLVRQDLSFHDTHPSGRLITRVQGDTQALRVLFTEVIVALPGDLVLLGGMYLIMRSAAPELMALVFWVLPPYALALVIFRRVAPPRFLALRKVYAGLTGFYTEMLRAMPVAQLYGRAAWSRQRSEDLNAQVYAVEVPAHLLPVFYFNAVFLVRTLGMTGVLWFGAGQVAAGELTVGALIMGLGYLRQIFLPLMRLSHHMTTLERARAAAIRIAELMDRPSQIADPAQPTPWPGLGEALRLEGVHFAYGDDPPVLHGLDLEIPAGAHVGVVGPTGSGKSTLLNLLLRFRDPTAGRVTVDGVDLRELRLDALRQNVGLVLQDVLLLPGTVLDNLGGVPEPAQAALATLGIEMALDAPVSEGGENLSRGERQLLTFARALVHDPDILVLDEATSAVDPATEARIQAALGALQRGRTTVTVAHRLATVRDCDRIVVLEAGRIAEHGTHDALLAADGVYAALHRLQHGEAA